MRHYSPQPEVVGSIDPLRAERIAARHVQKLERLDNPDDFSRSLLGYSTWFMDRRLRASYDAQRDLGIARYDVGRTEEHLTSTASAWHIDGHVRDGNVVLASELLLAVSCAPTQFLHGEIEFRESRVALNTHGASGSAASLLRHGIRYRSDRAQEDIARAIDDETVEVLSFDAGDVVRVPAGTFHRADSSLLQQTDLPTYRLIFSRFFKD